jgi:hypothetical protein
MILILPISRRLFDLLRLPDMASVVLQLNSELEFINYFAPAISSTICVAAARGSYAARIGLPTTRKSAPALIASRGVAVRA